MLNKDWVNTCTLFTSVEKTASKRPVRHVKTVVLERSQNRLRIPLVQSIKFHTNKRLDMDAESEPVPEPGTSSDKEDKKDLDQQLHVKAGGNCILVSPRQRGNPLLKSITNVPWQFDDRMIADYVMGQTTCALYLSMRYHNLNPDYIHGRLKILGKNYLLRVLLVMVDIIEPQQVLKTLTKLAILANLTIMLCRNSEEAGKIIERYKIYQYKPPDIIMKKKKKHPYARLKAALKTVRSISKTNAKTLLSVFGTLENILKTPKIGLAVCQGMADQKASRLFKILHQPFLHKQVEDGHSSPRNKKLKMQ